MFIILQYIFLKCYKTQEMCGKPLDRCYFALVYVADWYKTQEMCDRYVSEDPFLILYCPDKYKTQTVCDEAVDDCLAALSSINSFLIGLLEV